MSLQEATELTFESTAEWDEEYLSYAQRPLRNDINPACVSLSPPPANSSLDTRREIGALLEMKKERTPEILARIEEEIDLRRVDFGGVMVIDYFDMTKHPESAIILRQIWDDVDTIIMTEKQTYNRVRPSVLKEDIEPAIDVPKHPAYPSGHATQAFLLAHVLSAVYPEHTTLYFARAEEIARRREVAGVHYESDTKAGKELARQLSEVCFKDYF